MSGGCPYPKYRNSCHQLSVINHSCLPCPLFIRLCLLPVFSSAPARRVPARLCQLCMLGTLRVVRLRSWDASSSGPENLRSLGREAWQEVPSSAPPEEDPLRPATEQGPQTRTAQVSHVHRGLVGSPVGPVDPSRGGEEERGSDSALGFGSIDVCLTCFPMRDMSGSPSSPQKNVWHGSWTANPTYSLFWLFVCTGPNEGLGEEVTKLQTLRTSSKGFICCFFGRFENEMSVRLC